MAKMTLYGRRTSINVQKALWALRELELPFDWVEADSTIGWPTNPDYLQNLNPNGRVPTLVVDGTILHQSNVIVRYLAYTYAKGTLWPEDPMVRALSDVWMDWQQTECYQNLTPVFWGLIRTPPEKRNLTQLKAQTEKLHDNFRVLDRALKGKKYVAGDSFTMGDIPAGAALYRYKAMELNHPPMPDLDAYYKRLQERPVYRADIMIPLS
jgi:glutathione S-transferase